MTMQILVILVVLASMTLPSLGFFLMNLGVLTFVISIDLNKMRKALPSDDVDLNHLDVRFARPVRTSSDDR